MDISDTAQNLHYLSDMSRKPSHFNPTKRVYKHYENYIRKSILFTKKKTESNHAFQGVPLNHTEYKI